ncbi:MAG: DedA family protein [Alphaproteobacteria bacterium]|nr:DedA family protein [Alphaproteobacteria bacterium]
MKIINKILDQSAKPWYTFVVFVMTVCESIFLFSPPEVFMTPAIVAEKKRAWSITLAAAFGSIVGGAIAYMIGYWLYDVMGTWLITTFANPQIIPDATDTNAVQNMIDTLLNKWGIWMIAITAVTPIPYKVLAICLGLCHYPILLFLGVSAIFRTARFAIVGYLLWRFQETANTIVKKYSWQLTIGAIIFALFGLVVMTLM